MTPSKRTRSGRRWRREVVAFADAMEAKLRENDHKGGWQGDAATSLLARLREETEELESALMAWDASRVLPEAADVANFAMMIADVRGGLTTHTKRGRP